MNSSIKIEFNWVEISEIILINGHSFSKIAKDIYGCTTPTIMNSCKRSFNMTLHEYRDELKTARQNHPVFNIERYVKQLEENVLRNKLKQTFPDIFNQIFEHNLCYAEGYADGYLDGSGENKSNA